MFYQPNAGFGGVQSQPNSGFGFQSQQPTGFQSQQSTGFGQFQATQQPTTGFGQFQTVQQPTTGFGQFQGGTGATSTTGFGQFQGGTGDFDAFNPRGGSTATLSPSNTLSPQTANNQAFANFNSPQATSQQASEKKPAFEGSHLVNLNNLVEDPSSKQSAQAEKKTLGQAMQQKQTNKPVMQGGVLTPSTSIGGMQPNPLLGQQAPVNPLMNPLAMNPQNLTPQQLQQLQLQYQMQLLALQHQQLQGGRGF